MIYLYVKTHNKTGLKYLGKTSQNPFVYRGSGKYWRNHIKKHGNDVSTSILCVCHTNEEIAQVGSYYSQKWNVKNSEEWANLKNETGDGGAHRWDGMEKHLKQIASKGGHAKAQLKLPAWNKGKSNPRSPESIEKQRQTLTGKKRGHYKTYNAGTHNSVKVVIEGKEYPSIAAYQREARVSYYTALKLAKIS